MPPLKTYVNTIPWYEIQDALFYKRSWAELLTYVTAFSHVKYEIQVGA